MRVDHERHEVFIRGAEVRLPLKEFELLALLLENAGRVLTRETLIDRVWGADYVGDTKTLDVHIKRLRSKVELDPAAPDPHRHHPRPRLQVREPPGLSGPSRVAEGPGPGPAGGPPSIGADERRLPAAPGSGPAAPLHRLRRSPGWPAPTPSRWAATPCSPSAWPARCSSPCPSGQAQWKVGLYLLLTFAPFAVAAPLIGPVIDRLKGGRRWMIIGSLALPGAAVRADRARHLPHHLLLRGVPDAGLRQGLPDLAGRGRAHHGAQRPGAGRGQLEAEPAQRGGRRGGRASPAPSCSSSAATPSAPQLTVGLAAIVFAVGAGFATLLPKVVVAERAAGRGREARAARAPASAWPRRPWG